MGWDRMEALFSSRYGDGRKCHMVILVLGLLGFLLYWYGAVRFAFPSHHHDIWVSLAFNMVIYYVNFQYIWPKVLTRIRWRWARVLGAITGNLLFIIAFPICLSLLVGNLEFDSENFTGKALWSLVNGTVSNFVSYVLPNLLSLLASWMAFVIESFYAGIQEARAAWRRAQLDPHLLDTHLSMLSVLTVESPEKVPQVLQYTNRVVHFCIGSNDPQACIQLVDEIECIGCMIKTQHIRYGDALNWRLEVDTADLKGVEIIPMVVMPLAENMIRYGVLNRAYVPAVIRVQVVEGSLRVTTENQIYMKKGRKSNGTGLSNLRERLQYAYPDRYQLVAREDNGWFYTELVIAGIVKTTGV